MAGSGAVALQQDSWEGTSIQTLTEKTIGLVGVTPRELPSAMNEGYRHGTRQCDRGGSF